MQTPNPIRDRKAIAILALILVILLGSLGTILGLGLMPGVLSAYQNSSVPGAPYHGTSLMNINLANNTAANETIPSYVQVIKQNRTIIFHSTKIDLPVFAYPNFVASAVVNESIPAYDCNAPCPSLSNPALDNQSLSNSFTIYGIILPTLVIPRGATLNVTFINMDPTDHHNFVLTTFPPPYPEYIMQNMKSGGEMVAMTPLLDPLNSTAPDTAAVFQYFVTLNLPSSVTNMWYMCMFPTHAMAGMWGNITLADPSTEGG